MKFLLVTMILANVASGAPPTPFETTVSKAQAALNKVTYLPYRFRADGCYARAYYVAMELAVNDILPHVQIVSGEFEVGGWTWLFHAAPAIVSESEDETRILDRTFSDKPLPLKDWLVLLNPTRPPVKYFIPGSVYAGADDFSMKQAATVRTLKELPAFRSSEVEAACNDLREKWELLEYPPPFQPIDPKNVAASKEGRKKLKSRTNELIALLKARTLWEGAEVINCEKTDVE